MFQKFRDSILFRIGAIGYIAGFLAWIVWLLLVVYCWALFTFRFIYPTIMSGIFFQDRYFSLIVNLLFAFSFLLGSLGCFGLKTRYGSNLGLLCGIVYLFVFSIRFSYIVTPRLSLWMYAQTVPYIGLIIGGATFLIAGKYFQRSGTVWLKILSRVGGAFFLLAGLVGLMLLPAILWWGFEAWLMAGGWLYATGAIVSAAVLNKLSKT